MSSHSELPARRSLRGGYRLAAFAFGSLCLLLLAACDGSSSNPPPVGGPDPVPPAVPPTVVLAGDVDGVVYQIDPDTGALTLLVETGLGSILSMAFDPVATTLYGFIDQSTLGDCDQCLYKQLDDPTTGPLLIGQHVSSSGGYTVNLWDLTVDGTDGALYATDSDECPAVINTDLTTTEGTVIVSYNCSIYAVGISHDGSGLLYAAKQSSVADHLSLIDPVGMTDTPLNDITYTGFGLPPAVVQSLTVHPTSGLLLGLTDVGDLVHVDQCTSEVTYVATPSPAVMSLELVGTAPLPYPPGVCDPNGSEVGSPPYDQIDVSWRSYPVANSFALYYLNWSGTPGTIDPANPGTYDGKLTGLTGTDYTFTGISMCENYDFVLAAVVDSAEVAHSEQFTGLTACP